MSFYFFSYIMFLTLRALGNFYSWGKMKSLIQINSEGINRLILL